MRTMNILLVIAMVCSVLQACGGDASMSTGTSGTSDCVPGTTVPCNSCPGEVSGVQACTSDGSFGACKCPDGGPMECSTDADCLVLPPDANTCRSWSCIPSPIAPSACLLVDRPDVAHCYVGTTDCPGLCSSGSCQLTALAMMDPNCQPHPLDGGS